MHDNRGLPFDIVPTYSEFSDPRLVAIYDTVNPISGYRGFYLELAAKLSALSIVDIGCGTGLLTCELSKHGHHLIGVEPSDALLDLARHRPCGEQVTWIEGDARHLGVFQADLAIMTGHVAQFFLDDESWQTTLTSIYIALRPGGHIAFESRNPMVQPWTNNRFECYVGSPSQTSRRRVDDPVAGPVEWWTKLVAVHANRMRYENHYLFVESGEALVSVNELKFRTQAELNQSLVNAGFSVESVCGDWNGRLASAESSELIVVARRG